MNINVLRSNLKKKKVQANLVSGINVTPLVDVMLVLLIIFMITSPMLTTGINVNLPETNSGSVVNKQDDPLVITINKNSEIYILESKINKKNLAKKLIAVTKEKFDTYILIRGDKDLPYGEIVGIFSEITNAGFTKLALITNMTFDEKS